MSGAGTTQPLALQVTPTRLFMAIASTERQCTWPISSRRTSGVVPRWLGPAVDLVFPNACSLCGVIPPADTSRQSASLCFGCVSDVDAADPPACSRCARPLPVGANVQSPECPGCRDKQLAFGQATAIGVYEGKLREAVLRMKQATGETLALALGRLLAERMQTELMWIPDRIVPVPTHWTRRLGRDVNCAELLAEAVGAELRMRVAPNLLRCRRRMEKQGTLLPTERQQNVRGAYAARRGYDVRGQKLLVVDDVMTTGATANEVAKVLRKVGATGVSIAVVARGIGFDG